MTVGEISYFVRGRVEVELEELARQQLSSGGWSPAVVINVADPEISEKHIIQTFERFSKTDDVFSRAFQEGLVILQSKAKLEPFSLPSGWTFHINNQELHLPNGPYFVKGGSVHQAWRLYADDLDAFLSTSFPDDDVPYKFHPLQASAYDGISTVAAVPSRLYFPESVEKPLNGKRITVKDNFHIDGMITTLGNKAFAKYYGTQSLTSEYLKHVVDLGAIIVGKTKLSSFAGTEVPPRGPIDYFAPFNPRADGYQGPQGSSSGAGASAAGYAWIDASICTDTTGSCRGPAQINGVWGLRTTWGSTPMEGIVPSAQQFDTVGLMTRSSEEMQRFVDTSIGTKRPLSNKPTKLIYPTDWLPTKDSEQMAMIEDFTGIVEKSLGVTRTEVSLSEEWALTAPEGLRAISIADYLRKTGLWVNMYPGYQNFESFREGYKSKFGVKPYTSPVQSSKWEQGSQITKEMFDEGLSQIKVFKDWVDTHVMSIESNGNSPALMVLAVGLSQPLYRDRDPEPGAGGGGSYNGNFFSSLLGLPQLVVPIGQKPYLSKITDRTEYFPIVAGITSTQGMDSILVKTAHTALQKAGWPTQVCTGSLMFELGDNSRHVKTDS